MMKRPLWELNMKEWCFHKEGDIDVVLGAEVCFCFSYHLRDNSESELYQGGRFSCPFPNRDVSLRYTGKYRPSIFVLLLILPLRNEGILLSGASISLG